MPCSGEPGHPRYQADGEGADQTFGDGELLYRRYLRQHFTGDRLLPAAFRVRRPSFNRQKYSEPEDVLHSDCCDGQSHEGYGVLECSATDLPTPIEGADQRVFHFSAVHQPCECCYAHTEIWCVSAGEPVDEPSKSVREAFRIKLALKMIVRKEATV